MPPTLNEQTKNKLEDLLNRGSAAASCVLISNAGLGS